MMKKIYERLRERLGHKPTVKNFDAFLVTLGPDERESWKMDVCSLGYGDYYRKMPGRTVNLSGSIWSMTGSANGVIYVSIRCVVICCIPISSGTLVGASEACGVYGS